MNVALIVFNAVFFGGLALCLLMKIILSADKEIKKHKLDNELKYKLIERGLSVQEIERLLNCNPTDENDDELKNRLAKPQPPVKNYRT